MRDKGTGSVYFRESDQRWCGTISLPNAGNTRRRKTVTAKTKAEAQAKLTDLKRRLEKHGDLPTKSISLEAWLRIWYERQLKELRPKTAANWKSILELHIIPAIGNARLEKLTPDHVRQLHSHYAAKGLSPTTALLAHRILSIALNDAIKDGKATTNVTEKVDAPRKQRTKLVIPTASDAFKVIREMEHERLGSRWATAFLTGARQGEVIGLEIDRVSDVLDLSWQLQRFTWEHGCKGKCGRARGAECPDRTITFPADFDRRHLTGGLWLTRPKSNAGWRIIPLIQPLRGYIERRLAAALLEPNPHGLVWTADKKLDKHGRLLELDGSPLDPGRDNKAWHAVLDRAGMTQARLHSARHTTASALAAAGVDKRMQIELMGHSSHATTMDYQDVDRPALERATRDFTAQFELDA